MQMKSLFLHSAVSFSFTWVNSKCFKHLQLWIKARIVRKSILFHFHSNYLDIFRFFSRTIVIFFWFQNFSWIDRFFFWIFRFFSKFYYFRKTHRFLELTHITFSLSLVFPSLLKKKIDSCNFSNFPKILEFSLYKLHVSSEALGTGRNLLFCLAIDLHIFHALQLRWHIMMWIEKLCAKSHSHRGGYQMILALFGWQRQSLFNWKCDTFGGLHPTYRDIFLRLLPLYLLLIFQFVWSLYALWTAYWFYLIAQANWFRETRTHLYKCTFWSK